MAEEFVSTGVGLLAGSTILLLTLVWGTCILVGVQKFPDTSRSNPSRNRKHNFLERASSSLWPGCGVMTDVGTSYTAMIMLISVVPLIFILIPSITGGQRYFVPITLVVSIVFLLSYFFYQFFQPWIQRRQLLYIKHEHLVIDVLKHVQKQTMENLLKPSGSPNVSTFRSIFEKGDRDSDKVISFSELKEFLQEIKFRELQSNNDSTTAEIMKEFDVDNDQKITVDEFVNGMRNWLEETKETLNKRYHSVQSLKDMYNVVEPWIQKKREARDIMRRLVPDIVFYLQNSICGSLLAADGTPDVSAIKRLFKDIDLDKDNYISSSELKELVANMKCGIVQYDPDVAASKIMEELDISRDQNIDEEEFVAGLCKWLDNTYYPISEECEEDDYQKTWEQTDKLVEDKFTDKSPIAWIKAISLLMLGIFMLGILAEPLIHSVRDLSTATNIPSFFVAFIFIPLATNARSAVSAISEARKKKLHTTSLTFSEIYGTVFINNVLGLVVLMSLIYFRSVPWTFTAEVVMVLVASIIVGLIASFSTVFSIWTSILGYVLYPLSLVLVYAIGDNSWLY